MTSLKLMIVLLLLTIHANLSAQSFNEINNSQSLGWYGLDFTKARMVGDFSGPITCSYGYQVTTADGTGLTADLIRDNLYSAWNNLILNEPKKYDLEKFFGGKTVSYVTDPVMKLNAQVSLDSIKVNGSLHEIPFSKEKLQQIIYSYKPAIPQNASGIGVSFVIEKFDRIAKTAVFNVVFFDPKTCQVLFSDRILEEPEGFACGLRNYWAGSVYNLLKTIKGKKWSKWKKMN